jgi:hypothetical protein
MTSIDSGFGVLTEYERGREHDPQPRYEASRASVHALRVHRVDET